MAFARVHHCHHRRVLDRLLSGIRIASVSSLTFLRRGVVVQLVDLRPVTPEGAALRGRPRLALGYVTLTPASGTMPVEETLTPRTFRECETTDWP